MHKLYNKDRNTIKNKKEFKVMQRICIPDWEYKERVKKAAKLVAEKGLDVMLVCSTESDYANARYFSGFWPLFEREQA